MKNILLIILLLNISCKSNGQEKEEQTKNYQQIYTKFESVNPSEEKNQYSRIYNTYYVFNKDTVLQTTNEYKKSNKNKRDTIHNPSISEKSFVIKDEIYLIVFENGYMFLIQKQGKKYILLDEIKDEYETFYDDIGESYKTHFATGNIEHYRNNEYIITYISGGLFKIGVFEITENGIIKKFLSKGCLLYEEWFRFTFDFYTIKKEKIVVNYINDGERKEVKQIELKYEHGEYILGKNQCSE